MLILQNLLLKMAPRVLFVSFLVGFNCIVATWAAPGRAADLVLMKDGTSTVYMVETSIL